MQWLSSEDQAEGHVLHQINYIVAHRTSRVGFKQVWGIPQCFQNGYHGMGKFWIWQHHSTLYPTEVLVVCTCGNIAGGLTIISLMVLLSIHFFPFPPFFFGLQWLWVGILGMAIINTIIFSYIAAVQLLTYIVSYFWVQPTAYFPWISTFHSHRDCGKSMTINFMTFCFGPLTLIITWPNQIGPPLAACHILEAFQLWQRAGAGQSVCQIYLPWFL